MLDNTYQCAINIVVYERSSDMFLRMLLNDFVIGLKESWYLFWHPWRVRDYLKKEGYFSRNKK